MGERLNVDFGKLKQEVSLAEVVARYGVNLRQSGDWLRGKCPLPTHTSTKAETSFGVFVAKNTWCCQSDSCNANAGRKGGDVLDFVRLMDGCSVLDAAKKLMGWFPQNGETKKPAQSSDAPVTSTPNPTPVAEENKAVPIPEQNKPLGFELKGITYHPYLETRGITEETARKLGIGFFPGKGSMSGRIVFPIRNEKGELVAYAGRSINGEEPKYKLPTGFKKSHVLYNRQALEGSICCIVEGFFDCVRVSEVFPCVALMGCTLSEEQEKLLPENVYLMLDGDEAGREATKEVLPRLARNRWVKLLPLPDGKQPDSLSTDELTKLFSARA